MVAASLLALGLITYFIYLVSAITQKADAVFGEEQLDADKNQAFNFAKYDEIVKRLYPGSTTLLSAYSIPGPSVATTTVATTTNGSTTTLATSTIPSAKPTTTRP